MLHLFYIYIENNLKFHREFLNPKNMSEKLQESAKETFLQPGQTPMSLYTVPEILYKKQVIVAASGEADLFSLYSILYCLNSLPCVNTYFNEELIRLGVGEHTFVKIWK